MFGSSSTTRTRWASAVSAISPPLSTRSWEVPGSSSLSIAPAPDAAVDDVDHVARAVRAARRLAATAARWPEAQIAATGRSGSSPSGSPWRSWYGRVERARDVAARPTRRARARRAIWMPSRRGARAARARSCRSIRADVAPLLAPGGHAAGEVAGEVAQPDGRGEVGGAASASSSSRPTSTSGWPGSAIQASLEPKPARRRGDAHRARDVGLVELQLGADVDDERAARLRLLDLARGERVRVGAVDGSGPRLRATIARKFGGCGPRRGGARPRRTGRASPICSSGWRARSKPIVEAILRSIPGPPQSEPPRWPGHTSHASGRRRSVRAASGRCRARPRVSSTARSGRAMSPTNSESPVSTAHGCVAAGRVDERERRVLGAVAGRVQRPDAQRSRAELPAVVERLVLVVGRGEAVDVDRRPGRGGEPAVARDMVGVVVRLEHVLDPHAEVAGQAQVLADVEPRVDHRGHPRVLVADRGSWRSRGRRA